MFSPISVGAYFYQQILGSPRSPGGEQIDDNQEVDNDEEPEEIESPDAQDEGDKPALYQKRGIVDEIPIEISTHKADESSPHVRDLLQALTGDDDGDVNENFPKQTFVRGSDDPSGSDEHVNGDADSKPQNEVKNGGQSNLNAADIWNSLETEQNPERLNGFSADSDSEDLPDVGGFHYKTDDKFDTDEMDNRMFSSPEPEMPFTQSKIKDTESSNINGLLESLKDAPKPKPSPKPHQPPSKGSRKVTDEEVADALQFLLGRGGHVPRTRSAMDLRDDSARRLRGDDQTGSRAFVLVMMPDGTQRRVSVDRRPSLGNDLDSDDEMNLVGKALLDLTPGTYQRKIPKNDFDGREERPPTPRDSSSSTSSVSSNEDNATEAKLNPDASDHDQYINSKDYPRISINDGNDDTPLHVSVRDEEKSNSEDPDVFIRSSYKPNDDKLDLSNLYKLTPDGETVLTTESSKSSEIAHVTVDDLVDNLPTFDSESDSDNDEEQRKEAPTIIEEDIQLSVAVIPEESVVDLNILEYKPQESSPNDETRSSSSSDASSRSTLRPHGISDASSRSSDWQVDTEDEIIPESKISTETSPDLSNLEKLRPAGMEAPHLEVGDTSPSSQTADLPTEKSSATVKELEHILPTLESSSESEEEINEHDDQQIHVDEEPLFPVTVSPDNAEIDLSSLDNTNSDLEDNEGDDSRPYDVSDILDDLSSTEEDWPVPPESPVQQNWPAPPDDGMYDSKSHDYKFDNEDYDLPPPPPGDIRSSSRSSMSSPENRTASFMAVEGPKRPGSRGSASTSSVGKDPKTKKTTEAEPPAIVVTASSDVDIRHTDDSDEDVFNEDQNQEIYVQEEDAVVSIVRKPPEMTPDLRALEQFGPDGPSSIHLESSPRESERVIPSRERGKVSDLEDLVPKFDSSSESDNDDVDDHRPPQSPVVEAEICMSEAPQPEESVLDLTELDRNMRENSDKQIPRRDTELSTESQEFTMDFEDSDADDIVIPVSLVPVESTPDLTELERKLRPPGTKSPVIDIKQQLHSGPTERSGATVEDLKDLVPTFDTTSESSQTDSSEPTTPVEEMIEEIGTVSPTRKHFNFDGLESLKPQKDVGPSLETYAQQKSGDIIVESYMSLFREERVMELLKVTSSDNSPENSPSHGTVDNEFLPDINVRERISSSSSAEGGSSSGSDDGNEDAISRLPETDLHVPDSPAKKRRSVGQDVDVDDDEVPAKKPKTLDPVVAPHEEQSEPVIIEAGISVFREESVVESSPPAVQAKLETVKASSGKEGDWPAPPPDEEWPAPPSLDMMVGEDWSAPPEEGNVEPGKSENGKEDMDMDADDTSSVSSSSTEGEYITEPSPHGADRVFVLTVVPQMETCTEEDEDEEDETPENMGDITPPYASISEGDNKYVDSKPLSSSESESESSSGSREKEPSNSNKEKGERPSPEEDNLSIPATSVEPIESAPYEKSEMQPDFTSNNLNDIPKTEIGLEIQDQMKPDTVEKRRMSSSSDNSSAGDAKASYPHVKSDDEVMRRPNEESEEGYDEQGHFEPAPTSHDSETESDSTESSSGGRSRKSPFSPLGARVFILTGLPSSQFSDTPVSDNENDYNEKKPPETEDVDPSELKQSKRTEPIPDLIPAITPPAEREIPDFVEEPMVDIETIENVESAPVTTDQLSTEVKNTVEQSPESTISPKIDLDTLSSPIADTETHGQPDFSEVPSDLGVSEDHITLDQPDERFEEEDNDMDQAGEDFFEPEQPTFDKMNPTNEPDPYFEKSPSPSQMSSATIGHLSPSSSGHGPSFSHYISNSKLAEMSPPSFPNRAPKFHADNHQYITDDTYLSSDTEVAQFTANMPNEADITDPAVPNLAPYMAPSRENNSSLQYRENNSPLDHRDKYSPIEPRDKYSPFEHRDNNSVLEHRDRHSQFEPRDKHSPFEPMQLEGSPKKFSKNLMDPMTLDPIDYMPGAIDSRSSDNVDPASPIVYNSDILASKETDINDPGTALFIPESRSTDITDPAAPEYIPERSLQKSQFEPTQLESSPRKIAKPRPITPVELETSLVPPDVYTSDDAYEQFQVQYRGLDDDIDTIPQMRQRPPEPAKTKRKRPEEKRRKKEQAVSDMPSYMAPPPPIPSEVSRAKGKKVAPPTPPRIESDPLLREPRHIRASEPFRQPYSQPKRHSNVEMDEPPLPYQVMSRSTDVNIQHHTASYNTRQTSMEVSEFSVSHSSRSRSTDIIDSGNSYPMSRSMDYLSSEPAPMSIPNRPPSHARSVDMHSASMPHHAQPKSRTTDIDDPGLYNPRPMSKSTDITDPGFEPPVPRPTTAAPQYLVPNRGPLPDITKPLPGMHKDVELESLKRQLHRLGTKMSATRQELEHMKRNNPANRYARPTDRSAHSRGSSLTSIDSPDADMTDLKFSRKFFASLTDKEFGKMLEEMRLYRLAVREKGADLKRLSKQCDGIRLRLKQLGEPLDIPNPKSNTNVGAIETTI